MSSATTHGTRQPDNERLANRRMWIVTLLITAIILVIAVAFFLFGKAQH